MYQRIFLIGNLGKDPEGRFTPAGQMVTNFNIATKRTWNQNNERMSETTWWRVSTWGRLAEVCNENLRKGSKVLVECRMNIDPTTGGPRIFTRQDGTSGASFEVTAETVKFLDSKESNGEHMPAVEDDDDIPF